MVCLSQHHPAFCHQSDTESCTKCTHSTKFHNCTFWQQRCIEEKTNFLRPLWITQAGAGSNSGLLSQRLNGGIVKNSRCQPRVWAGTMSHCGPLCSVWTLCKHLHLIFTGHLSSRLWLSVLTTPGPGRAEWFTRRGQLLARSHSAWFT